MRLFIEGGERNDHDSDVVLSDAQAKYLQSLYGEGYESDPLHTMAAVARYSIEMARQAWQAEGQQDGPGSGP